MLSDLRFRLRAWLRPGRADRDLTDELAFHHDREVEKLEARGLSSAAATHHARIAFGSSSAVAEQCRDARGIRWLDETSRDLRSAVRGFVRTPVYTLAVAGSLVLGVGLNSTVFTLMRAALWRPLPIPAPEEIVHVRRVNPANAAGRESSSSFVLFDLLRDAAAPDADVVAKRTAVRRRFGSAPNARDRAMGEAVSDRWFAVLGVRPAAGRLLVEGDDSPSGGRAVAVLSHRFWTTRFAAQPQVIGQTIYFDEKAFTVVGVTEAGFTGVDAEAPVDLWMPVTADPAISPLWIREPDFSWLTLLARVRNPASTRAIETAVDGRFRSHLESVILPQIPARFRDRFSQEHIELRPAAAGLATTGRRHAAALNLLAGIAACVLLICCLNVANLVRARNDARLHEFALRRALGASRGRIFRQLAIEGAVTAGAAIAGGLAVAPWAGRLLLSLVPGASNAFDLTPDLTIIVATVAAGALTTLVAVVAPAWRTLQAPTELGAGARVSARSGTRRLMVALQLAAALVLLVVAGLCLTTMRRLQAVPLGFDPTSVLSVELSFPKATPGATVVETTERIRASLASSSLVSGVSYVSPWVYADNSGTSMGVVPVDYVPKPGEDTLTGIILAGPGFFDVIKLPVRQGRPLSTEDVTESRPVLLINEAFARKYYGDRSPIGLRLRLPHPKGPVTNEIIGVVADARHYGVRSEPWPMAYLPLGCGACGEDRPRLLVHTGASIPAIRQAVESVSPVAQAEQILPLDESVRALISGEHLLATLSVVIAAVAVALAALGLYGLVAYGASRRRTEFGIRLALGATPGRIRSLILKETMLISGLGVIAGLVGAVFAARGVERLVADSATLDWQTPVLAAAGLLTVALVAGWLPALRASNTDPATTLRAE